MKAARRISTVFFKAKTKEDGPGSPLAGVSENDPRAGWETKKTIDGIDYYYKPETGEVTWEDPADMADADHYEYTWVPHPTDMWQPAKVLSKEKDGSTVCETLEGKKVVIPAGGKLKGPETAGRDQIVPIWELKKNDLLHIEDDLIMLENVNDGSICYNLAHKYRKQSLYTWVGASHRVLISINPYQRLPLYGEDMIEMHHDASPNRDFPPHIFDIADGAYKQMLYEATAQSILISGESGAGKTEATKQCLKFWAKVAGSKNGVEDKLIQANPVLEAFGNAKTIRNNNSSRFGKWMEVYFSLKDRYIEGATITNFLLEKSRLAFQQPGERNFHIFYQLLSSKEMRDKYELADVKQNRYLNRGLTTAIPGMDDAADFADTQKAIVDLGLTKEEQEWLMRVPSAILHLGNCTFEIENRAGGVTGSTIANESELALAAKLLCVDVDGLRKPLLSRTITVRSEVSIIPLDPDAARAQCDSIAKGFYSRMFDWLVNRINQSLHSESTSGKVIGVLDIFGFEIFDVNSFEQLCINFCNEKLQQLFNVETFHDEEKLYIEEGIQFSHITINDSEPVLTMIEKGPDGLLPTLDDECKLEGDDVKYLNKITNTFGTHAKFQVDKRRKMGDALAFEVVHYAGVVNYTTAEFKLKNKDTFAQEGYDLGTNSKDANIAAMFPPLTDKMQVKTLSSLFRTQLNVLMDKLHKTSTRYVRCVKPNENMSPMLYEAPLVLRQLRYSGVFEAVEIRKQGYPFRFKYEVFAIRFACINPDHVYKAKDTDAKAKCQEIFATNSSFKELLGDISYGKTMLFYRAPVYKLLKLLRNLALEIIMPRVSGIFRGNLARWFRKFMTTAETELKAAYDTLTDMAQMKLALSHVDGHLGPIGEKIFPHFRPRFEQDCKDRIVLLQQCLDEEAKVVALLDQNDPNMYWQTWTEQKWTLESLEHVPKTKSQTERFAKFLDILANCEVQKLDEKSIACRKVMDKAVLEECQEGSIKWKHTSPAIEEVKRVLALPEVNFIELEFIAAKEMNDLARIAGLCSKWFGNVGGTSLSSLERAEQLVILLK
ncbi:hypothetical protein BASA81_009784 [Batrachochytrium salamandrivorans]|nr:hypothetical protein BASA81_009784 [Batrachochytrium salamandrivorans]